MNGPRARPGFALVLALLVLALAATVLLAAAARAESERRIALNTAADVRARAAARGGLAQLLVRLRALQATTVLRTGDPAAPDPWNRLDTLSAHIDEVALTGGARYRVAVSDPSGRLPLNYASSLELTQLFEQLGAASGLAQMDAGLVLAERQLRGRFGAVEDLARVDGLALPPGWRDYLTTLGDGRVNVNTAPRQVLAALPGLGDEAADAILARRDAGRPLHSIYELDGLVSGPAQAALRASFPALAGRVAFEPVVLELSAEGRVPGSPMRTVVSAVVARAGSTVQVISSVER